MANPALQVATSQQRQMIPRPWLLEFDDWYNSGLASLRDDLLAPRNVRAYAGWELEYRAAFNIAVEYQEGDVEAAYDQRQRPRR